MKTLIGVWLYCQFTLWLYVPQLKKAMPHDATGKCQVLEVNVTTVKTGAPQHVFVDCTQAFSWLDGIENDSLKRWLPLTNNLNESGCYE